MRAASGFLPARGPRRPLWRVQGAIDLFGVCCGRIFAMSHLVIGYGQPWFRRLREPFVVAPSFLALPSGPIGAGAQMRAGVRAGRAVGPAGSEPQSP